MFLKANSKLEGKSKSKLKGKTFRWHPLFPDSKLESCMAWFWIHFFQTSVKCFISSCKAIVQLLKIMVLNSLSNKCQQEQINRLLVSSVINSCKAKATNGLWEMQWGKSDCKTTNPNAPSLYSRTDVLWNRLISVPLRKGCIYCITNSKNVCVKG